MALTKEYLEKVKERRRRFDEAAAPLCEKLCESYDTKREVKTDLSVDFVVRAEAALKDVKHEAVVMSATEYKIFDQLTKNLEESGADSFTIADIRAASNKVFTGNKEGIIK